MQPVDNLIDLRLIVILVQQSSLLKPLQIRLVFLSPQKHSITVIAVISKIDHWYNSYDQQVLLNHAQKIQILNKVEPPQTGPVETGNLWKLGENSEK